MNFNFYLFGTPGGRYNQYPDDYIASLLNNLRDGTSGARLVIFREMNLVHYVYSERLDSNNIIGFCVIFNNAKLTRPKAFINLCRRTIEDSIITSGKIVAYDSQGILHYKVNGFGQCVKEYENLKNLFDKELTISPHTYGIETLKTTYNGVRSVGSISMDATDAEIITLTEKHNTVVINSNVGFENGYIEQVISQLRADNQNAQEKIDQLESEIVKINRQKKQYGWVAILSLAIIASLIGLYFLNASLSGEITLKNSEIAKLEKQKLSQEQTIINLRDSVDLMINEVSDKQRQISSLNSALIHSRDSVSNGLNQIQKLTSDLQVEKNKYYKKNEELSDAKSSLRRAENSLSSFKSSFPINITKIELANTSSGGTEETKYGNTIYSSRTMYIKPRITYTGINTGKSITLKVRFYTPSGLSTGTKSPSGFSYQDDIYVYSGSDNTTTLSGWGGSSKGHWKRGTYRIEIWYEDVCLKAKTFTIY